MTNLNRELFEARASARRKTDSTKKIGRLRKAIRERDMLRGKRITYTYIGGWVDGFKTKAQPDIESRRVYHDADGKRYFVDYMACQRLVMDKKGKFRSQPILMQMHKPKQVVM